MATTPTFNLDAFNRLREGVLRHRRIAGTYVVEAEVARSPVAVGTAREGFLRDFAARLGFAAPDVTEVEWRDAEVFRAEARRKLVEALVGGRAIGHSRWDVPPAEARALASAFVGLFGSDARFFCQGGVPTRESQTFAPYARPDFYDFIFGGGCVAVDGHAAAVMWVLDND
jgi:hypothetical protein